ncbi:MAG: FAD-dependent oxidoreductase [Candidatus Latescibacterota bacterium]
MTDRLLIVGGGSAAFAAAIRAAELGATAAIIERGVLGGTCVNVGCVPSQTLIRTAEVLHRAGHHGCAGIRAALAPPDFRAVVQQKDELVAELRQARYADVPAAYPSVSLMEGEACFRPDGALEVGGSPLAGRKVVLAMGASPWAPPIPGLQATPYLTHAEGIKPVCQLFRKDVAKLSCCAA